MRAKIVGQMNLHVLHSRLEKGNAFHLPALDAVEDEILKKQKERPEREPAHTNNMRNAFKKGFLKRSIRRQETRKHA